MNSTGAAGSSATLPPRPLDPLLSLEAFSSAPAHQARGPLHSGSTWVGVQRSGRNSYEVTVKFDEVDIEASKVCGTLEIKGLTPELDSLVTFFEGEIVGEVGSPGFRTGRFGATEFDDLKHWRRFPAFTRNRLERGLVKPELNLRAAKNKPFVFLRLKERFVVNHPIEAIHGASYAGFYYCCLDCEPSIVPLDSPSMPIHRGISPPSRQAGLPSSSRGRRESSTSSRGRPEPSLLAQTRPPSSTTSRTPSRARLSPPQVVVNLPSSVTGPLPPALTAPTPSRPAQPRRTSSGSISYAAAVRGEAPIPLPSSPSSSPTSLPDLSSSLSSASPSSSSSSAGSPHPPPVIEISEPSRPASTDLPTPKVEYPEPAFSIFAPLDSTAPSLPPIWQAVAAGPFSPSYNAAHFGQPAGPSTSPTDEEWPVPIPAASTTAAVQQVTPPPRPPAALRRMSSDVASVLAKAQARHGRGRLPALSAGAAGGRRKSAFRFEGEEGDVFADEEEEDADAPEGFDDRGLRSWTEATISGFYFHHSASPYQELSLRYVPSHKGGSADFSFR
ncbi:hypothetical protein JCM10908_001179 [Rhodotorula pacifica]|uniref:uncharacterized protein n=1 Tax=Rhodotorula pacifica TaxID=1495444 RepID=UPI00316F8E85